MTFKDNIEVLANLGLVDKALIESYEHTKENSDQLLSTLINAIKSIDNDYLDIGNKMKLNHDIHPYPNSKNIFITFAERDTIMEEGWVLWQSDIDLFTIVCEDDLDIIDSDKDAWALVKKKASEGSQLHIKALQLVKETNYKDYEMMMNYFNK
jgi:hypothetical protein